MKKLLCSLLAASLTFAAYAQKDRSPVNVVSSDSLNVFLKSYLEQTTGQRFEDPTIPRFLLTDRNDMFVFGIGGYVGSKMIFDLGGNKNTGFETLDRSLSQYQNESLGLNLSSSRFFFKILGRTGKGISEAYIEASFSGPNNTLKLQKAYVNLFGFRVGLTTTAFSDNETVQSICDNTQISYNDKAVPMFEYSYLFKNGLRVQGGIELPQSTMVYLKGEDNNWGAVKPEMPFPDFTLNGYYKKDRLHLYAGSYLRIMQFYDFYTTKQFKKKIGYAFQVSGNYTFGDPSSLSHKVYLQAQLENQMSDNFANIETKGLTLVQPNRLGWTKFDPISGLGAQLGYRLAFGDNSFNLQASFNEVYGHERSNLPDLYKWGFVSSANYMRKVFVYGLVGIEAVYGQSYTLSSQKMSDFRVVALARYNF